MEMDEAKLKEIEDRAAKGDRWSVGLLWRAGRQRVLGRDTERRRERLVRSYYRYTGA